MPRYFFHIHDREEIIDNEGTVLANADEARAEAVRTAGAMLKDIGGRFWGEPEWRLWVTDEDDTTICALRFSVE